MTSLITHWKTLALYGRGTDKGSRHSYLGIYETLFEPYCARPEPVRLLEIGVDQGHSLALWRQYFGTRAEIHGVDVKAPLAIPFPQSRLNVTDGAAIAREFDGRIFDIVIDDGSHILADQLAAWENLSGKLAPGGVYVVEDCESIEAANAIARATRGRQVSVIDLRVLKGCPDDILVVIR